MILGNQTNDAKDIFNKISFNSKMRYDSPIGEIKAFSYRLPENNIYKLCDSNNILRKSDYPDLYEVIKDIYKDFAGRTLLDSEFAIPNLEGRYLAMRNTDEPFEYTDASIQTFALETVEYYSYLPSNSKTRDYFKSISDSTSSKYDQSRFIKPVKKVLCEINDRIRTTVSTDDKVVLFYIRVR